MPTVERHTLIYVWKDNYCLFAPESPRVAGGTFQETQFRKLLVKQIIRADGAGSS